ncbi:MAG: crotonase/enoyl-CoA hydratase family protein [Nitriliruptorales bacterium]|nr:crotonase/enoyl-CoA hydratase family protein [Nitriliruptorales bacterium]
MSEQPHALVEKDGHVVTVTMNRPEAKNALSGEMLTIMAEAWDMIDEDPDVRCAILTGAGGVFCAGADLKAMGSGFAGRKDAGDTLSSGAEVAWKGLLRNHRLRKPLIAAVEGWAVAGGTEILQATDIRVAGESATFGVTEATRGLFPMGGSTVRLQRQIPLTHAMDILLTGRHVPAPEALAMGLIGRVVPDGQALAVATEIAGQVAANAPLSVQAIKASVLATAGLPEQEALPIELQTGIPVFMSKDAKEGAMAFAEKRPPVWSGE